MDPHELPRWEPVYVGLGSNVGDSRASLERGVVALGALPDTLLIAQSALYRSRPLGPVDQPDFLNAVVGLLSRLCPERWLHELQSIERQLGRSPQSVRWGPREIDLDLLLHGQTVSESLELQLPHPGISVREFVLYPLRDIAADLRIGVLGTVRELADRVEPRGIERLEF